MGSYLRFVLGTLTATWSLRILVGFVLAGAPFALRLPLVAAEGASALCSVGKSSSVRGWSGTGAWRRLDVPRGAGGFGATLGATAAGTNASC